MKKKFINISLISSLAIGAFAFVAFFAIKGEEFSFANADLICNHEANHYSEKAPTEILPGFKEYWVCCKCHTSFKDAACTQAFENTSGKPTDPADGRYLAPIGGDNFSNLTLEGSVSEEPAPSGYNFTKVFEMSGKQGQFIFGNETSLDITGYKRVSFAMKGGVWFILRNSWGTSYGPDSWKIFTLEQTGDKVWSIYSADQGGDFSLKYSDISGSTIKEITGFGGESSTYYVTNLRVTSKDIARPAIVAESSVCLFETTTEIPTLEGFTTVVKGTKKYDEPDQSHEFLDDISMDGLDSLSFGFKTLNRQLCDSSWGNPLKKDTWFIFTCSRNLDGTFNGTVTDAAGNVKFSYTNRTSFRNSLMYYNYGGDPMVWYSTEVRGNVSKDAPSTTLISDNAFCANGIVMQDAIMNAPSGFTSVKTWSSSTSDSLHGMFYSDAVLSSYATVTFAIKTTGYLYRNSGSDVTDNALWSVFTLTNAGNDLWNIEITGINGTSWHTASGLSDYKGADPGVYTNHALNALLYGNPSVGYVAIKRASAPFQVWATELRGTLA